MLKGVHQTLSAANALALDKELMSVGGFSLDQLMELAGLAVSEACITTKQSSGASRHESHSSVQYIAFTHPPKAAKSS